MIHIYLLKIDFPYQMFMHNISEKRASRINMTINEEAKKQLCASGLLLDYVIEKYRSEMKFPLELSYEENGKPYLVDNDLYFNLSHSSDYVICGISNKPIGVDIEKIRDINDKLINKIATPEELEQFRKYSSADRLDHIFKIWTAKESYLKLLGIGLKKDMREVTINYNDKKHLLIDNIYHCYQFRYDEYFIAISTLLNEEYSIIEVNLNE